MASFFNGSALLLRKHQLAAEYNRKQVLRHHFTQWQHWGRAEILKRELARTKGETRKKMNALLKAVSLGRLSGNGSSGISPLEEGTAMEEPPMGEVRCVSFAWSSCLSINHLVLSRRGWLGLLAAVRPPCLGHLKDENCCNAQRLAFSQCSFA